MNQGSSSRWRPGISGNPQGRRPGSGTVQALRTQIELMVPEIIQKMTQKALEGDVAAARLLLERAIPPLKPSEPLQGFELPLGGPAAQAKAILAQGASGGLSVGQVAHLVGALSSLGRLIEVEELERRIVALEDRHEAPRTS